MKIIYSYVEPWVVDQNVYLMTDSIEPITLDKIPLSNLVEYIALKYQENNCDKVILHGSNYAYTAQIGEDIQTFCLQEYGINNMNVEVIKE